MNGKTESLIEIYQSPHGRSQVALRLPDETAWPTQAHMAELFEVAPQNITMHLKNVYARGEWAKSATCIAFLQVQTEGSRKVIQTRKHDSLDANIICGLRCALSTVSEIRNQQITGENAHYPKHHGFCRP